MQLVYELLLKFVMSNEVSQTVVLAQLSPSFLKKYLELFDSEDPRERDYLKTILHRMYGKYMPLRQNIKQ